MRHISIPTSCWKYSTLYIKCNFACTKVNMSSKSKKREDFKQEDVLQAVVIADSFNIRFAPITKDKPRVSTAIQVKYHCRITQITTVLLGWWNCPWWCFLPVCFVETERITCWCTDTIKKAQRIHILTMLIFNSNWCSNWCRSKQLPGSSSFYRSWVCIPITNGFWCYGRPVGRSLSFWCYSLMWWIELDPIP